MTTRNDKAAVDEGAWQVEIEGGKVLTFDVTRMDGAYNAICRGRPLVSAMAPKARAAVLEALSTSNWSRRIVAVLEPGASTRAQRDALAWRSGADEMRLRAAGKLSERADKEPGTEAGDAARKALLDAAEAVERMPLPRMPGQRPLPAVPNVAATPTVLTFVAETVAGARRLLGRSPNPVEIGQALLDAVRARLATLPAEIRPDADEVATYLAGLIDRTSIPVRLAWLSDANGLDRLRIEVQAEDGAWRALDDGAGAAEGP